MCTIDRMLIKGIRSFSPQNRTVIAFYKPLTLIVGANGAGKTTIIECLKQACTGELPPNTRSGQSFIHDPKVAHETEVKASIMLRFHTNNGQEVTVVRSFQLTQKKTALQFKTLDSTIKTRNRATNQDTAITYKCADIDKIVPGLMGVSKAVLENVIFVHQEESNWPLAEGKVLKDRFDDIFAATKYTKALETLRKLRTEKTQQIKVERVRLDLLRTHKDAAAKLQVELEHAISAVADCDEEAGRLNRRIQECNEVVGRLEQSLAQLSSLSRETQVAHARLEELGKQLAAKRVLLEGRTFSETTAELQKKRSEYEWDIENARLKVAQLKREQQARQAQLAATQDTHNQKLVEHSGLKAGRDAHEARLRDRDVFVRDTARKLGVSLPVARLSGGAGATAGAVPLSDASVERFEAALREHVADMERQLAELKAAHQQRDEVLSSEVDTAHTALTAHHEQLRSKRDTLRRHRASIEQLAAQAEGIVVNEASAEEAERRLQAVQDALRAKNEELAKGDFDARLVAEKRALDEVVERIKDLRQARDQLASAGEGATRLRLKEAELAEKQEAVQQVLRTRRTLILGLLHPASELPPVGQLRTACDAALARRKEALSDQGQALHAAREAESAARAQLTAARAQLASAEAVRTQLLARLRSNVAPSADLAVRWEPGQALNNERVLNAVLARMKEEVEKLSRKVTHLEALGAYANKLKARMEEEHTCPVCARGFSTDAELYTSVATLEEEVSAQPARLADKRRALASAQHTFELLSGLSSEWRRLTDVETREIQEASSRIPPLEAALAHATAGVNDASDVHATTEHDVASAAKLVAETVWQLDRQVKEVATLEAQVASLRASVAAAQASVQGLAVGADGRMLGSVSECDDELEQCEVTRANRENVRDHLQRRQARLKEEVLARTRELGEAKDAVAAAHKSLDTKQDLQRKASELEAGCAALTADLAGLEARTPGLVTARDEAQARRAQERSAMQAEESRVERELRSALQLQDAYQAKAAPLREYMSSGAEARLAAAQAAMDTAVATLTKITQELGSLDEEVSRLSEALTQQEVARHQLDDELAVRAAQASMEEQQAHLRKLQAQQKQVGIESVLQGELQAASQERAQHQQALDMSRGVRQMQEQAATKAREALKSKEYKDSLQQYNRQYAKVLYAELANADLDKYHKALEKALLSFHTTKMADINKIIKELWQKTYRGQDIDYIQIKADADTTRSYNYRVVMYSGGAELDMRGRCSAGQKVLACLIIRLALAEVFCLNCGILALDEPTTNLDADNAASLADALRAIMAARREQLNFQLIIITHDEAFAHQIGTREQADSLWRITKDENQHTHLSCEAIDA